MSGVFVTRNDDYGMFQPGGYFEYLDDERVNSLPPPELGSDARTAPGGLEKYDSEQVLQFIDDARKRPPFKSSRLKRLTEKTNMENEWDRYRARFEHESLATHWNKMIASIIGIFDDMISLIPDTLRYDDNKKKTASDIFLSDDRLFYLGLCLTLCAIIWKTLS